MISLEMEKAWIVDEGIRLREALARHAKREYWRKRILDIEEHHLPTQAYPLKSITKTKAPFSAVTFGRSIIRSVLP